MQFKAKGVKVHISFTFFAAAAALMIYDKGDTALLSLLCALIHECGHLTALFLLKCSPKSISLGAFGMRIVKNDSCVLSDIDEIVLAAFGPLFNIISSAGLGVLRFGYSTDKLIVFSAIHLGLGLFNLIPVSELDGGRILFYIFKFYKDENFAKKASKITSIIILIPLCAAGFYVLIKSRYNFSLLLVCIYLVALVIFKKK